MQAAELVDAFNEMPESERTAARASLGIDPPAGKTRDVLWLIVVAAFALVLIGAFVVLAIGVFVQDVKPELILTMFTSVVGFLAGLFAPSPVSTK